MRPLSLLLAAALAAGPALAEDRGVVVANAGYVHADAVTGADAEALAKALEAAGFQTATGADLDAAGTRAALAGLLRPDPDPDPGARLVLLSGRFLHGAGDAWFMGVDADRPDLLAAGAQGVPLSVLMGLMGGGVLLLGSEGGAMAHAAGLADGIGPLVPPPGVTVISGPPEAVSAAAEALLVPGASVGAVVEGDGRLAMAPGGDAGLVLVPAVVSEGERDAWARAAAEDTAEAYGAYLSAYPSGAYAAAAQARLDGLGAARGDRDLWAEAAAANTLAAYEDYLARYPKGEFAEAATRRRDEMRPATPAPVATPAPAPASQAAPGQAAETRLALSRADRVAIQRRLNALGYATGGADGVFGPRSRQAIRGWQQRNGLAATGYLTAEQIALMRDQAASVASQRERDDEAYWQRTGAQGGAANLRAYLDRYPDGLHASAARARLAELDGATASDREQRAWDQARRADTAQAYTTYLRNWPRGAHADQARQRLDRLLRRGMIEGDTLRISPEAIIRELLR